MRSHDGYRALVVFATVLVHMRGTLAVRSASKRNGESSSLLWFSASSRLVSPRLASPRLALPDHPVLFFRFRYLPGTSLLPPRTTPSTLCDGHARAPLAAPPSSVTTCFLLLLLLRLLRQGNTSSSLSSIPLLVL